MNIDNEREYIISRLDFYYEMSECIINYFRKHTDVDFSIAKNTWSILKSQLQMFLKDYKAIIFMSDELYNYYSCISNNFEFIDNNLVTNGGSYYETIADSDNISSYSSHRPNLSRDTSNSGSNPSSGIFGNICRMVTSHWRR